MIYTTIFLSLAAQVLAQSNWTLPAGFDLNQVDSQTKSAWCLGQRNACPKICGGSASINRCDDDTLDFDCTCSNGTAASVELYKETVPFYVCEENFAQCISRSNSLDGDEECKAGREQCGSLNASAPSTTSTSTTSTTLPTETGSSTNDESQSETTPTPTGSAEDNTPTDGAMRLMQNYGLAGFATVMVAAFAML